MLAALKASLAAVLFIATAGGGVAAESVLIRDVSVVNVEAATIVRNRDVLVSDEAIAAVRPTGGSAFVATRVVDGRNRYLIPGLWDAHVHVFTDEIEPDFALPAYILNGVTSVRDMGAVLDLQQQQEIASEIAERQRIGPRILLHGALLDGPPGAWPGQMVASTPGEGRKRVRQAKVAGWNTIKAYSLLDPDTYLAIADEAGKWNMRLHGHVPEGVSLGAAVAAGHRDIAHFGRVTKACTTDEARMVAEVNDALAKPDRFAALMDVMAAQTVRPLQTWDRETCVKMLRTLAETGVAVTPTLMVSDFYTFKDPADDDPRMALVPRTVQGAWSDVDRRRAAMDAEMLALAPKLIELDWRTFAMAHAAGVPIMAGTDAAFVNPYLFHGFSLPDELERYVAAGLTSAQALATATTVPPRVLGLSDSGGIVPGARADLVLLSGDPLADISAVREIVAVVANGRLFDRNALDTLRRRTEAAAAVR